jgi:PilZ domain-containing protein
VSDTSRDQRARRYPIPLPLRYRQSGRQRWNNATTENISDSGVLFRGEVPMKPDTPIEMSLALPTGVPGEPPVNVMCLGRIVRVLPQNGEDHRLGLAASIMEFHFVRDQNK